MSVSRRFGGYVKVKRKPKPFPKPTPRPQSDHLDSDPLVGEPAFVSTSFLAPRPPAVVQKTPWQRYGPPVGIALLLFVAAGLFVLAASSDGGYVDASKISASARSSSPAYVSGRSSGDGGRGNAGSGISNAQAFLAANMAKHGGLVAGGGSAPSPVAQRSAASAEDGEVAPGYRRFHNQRCDITSTSAVDAAQLMSRCLDMGKVEAGGQ